MEQLSNIALDLIKPSSTNPRKFFNKKELKDLQASITASGVINPILVRPFPDNTYEIVAGERRYRASVELGLTTIPAIVRKMDDGTAMELQVIENLQRADVHPLDEAEGYAQLMNN
jgi:ParB family transcriptional regulator, chromosome partitioning protein